MLHLNFLIHFHVELGFAVILLAGWTTIYSSYHLAGSFNPVEPLELVLIIEKGWRKKIELRFR